MDKTERFCCDGLCNQGRDCPIGPSIIGRMHGRGSVPFRVRIGAGSVGKAASAADEPLIKTELGGKIMFGALIVAFWGAIALFLKGCA